MSHTPGNFQTLVNGWTVQARSPGIEHLEKILNEGGKTDPAQQPSGTRIDLDLEIDFTNLDPVLIRFDGTNATGQIYTYLDLHIQNHTGVDWTKFNMSAVDQESTPDVGDYNGNMTHPFFSHFHDVQEDSFDLFSRSGWNSVLRAAEPNNAPNAWEFSNGGVFRDGASDSLDFLNFRLHQYNKGVNGGAGGTFYVILTPNQSRVDYSGHVIKEDVQNVDFLGGDSGGAPRKDMLFGFSGDDLLKGFEQSDLLFGGAGDDRLSGGREADTLSGGSGVDLLDGGLGSDTMRGGEGNDTYLVDDRKDLISEADGEGRDVVITSLSFKLRGGQEIEGFATTSKTGTAAINLFGNERSQNMIGNAGRNTLDGKDGNDFLKGLDGSDKLVGGSGNDVLSGGLGTDKLTGGIGRDSFLFDSPLRPGNLDFIVDFKPADDTIRIDNAVFRKVVGAGTLSSSQFKDITDRATPLDGTDRILYNHDTGQLYYDPDGSGSAGRFQFALLNTSPTLTHFDFFIV